MYVLQSIECPNRYYTGVTYDAQRRLQEHNDGQSIHTNKYKPWQMSVCLGFMDDAKAYAFERYLKSGNGRIFANKHF